jgi:hypothetical protein
VVNIFIAAMFTVFGRSSVSEFLGDRIVYRNLAPADASLPSLDDLRGELGLPEGQTPRKIEPDYASVIVSLLHAARRQEYPGVPIQGLIFIGDTRLLDGTAFENICRAGGWSGLAFIGSETGESPSIQTVPTPAGQTVYLANRWAALGDFERYCTAQGMPIGETTAVVVDLDKTAIGARGRNAQTIDRARLRAVHVTVAGILGEAFDTAAFQRAYDLLNAPEFHPFTADNQDYLAYMCLILGSGLYALEQVVDEVRRGELASFRQFIDGVERRAGELPAALRAVHQGIYVNVQAGDPTPFKPFRRNEYLETVSRMGCLKDGSTAEQLLSEEIVITQEVRQVALDWRQRGALLFGLSDKPDEASLPTPELSARGYKPIHCTETHVVGTE